MALRFQATERSLRNVEVGHLVDLGTLTQAIPASCEHFSRDLEGTNILHRTLCSSSKTYSNESKSPFLSKQTISIHLSSMAVPDVVVLHSHSAFPQFSFDCVSSHFDCLLAPCPGFLFLLKLLLVIGGPRSV